MPNEGWGRLTIYVGAAPGVGKTYKMLQDANDWLARGVDVVAGFIETHGRRETAEQIGRLEVLPRKRINYQGHTYEELDTDAVIRRRPAVVLIDELAHSNVPGSRHAKRYEDIEDILRAGIDVVTTVNIQHLESLQDKVEHITGVKVRERVPDRIMDLADEIKLIDVTPQTLQERLMNGQIYAPDKIEAALSHFFQPGKLSALRELALLEVADDVDQRLGSAEVVHPERILVCVNYRPHSEKLIRRGWRIADRLKAELYVLVVATEPLSPDERRDLERIRDLSRQFRATFILRSADQRNVGPVIVEVAESLQVSQIVIGQPQNARNGPLAWTSPNPIDYVLRHAEFMDLHVVSSTRESSAN